MQTNSLTQELRSQIITAEQEATFWSKIARLSRQRNNPGTPGSDMCRDSEFSLPDEFDMKDNHNLIAHGSRQSLSIAPSMSLSRSIEDAWEDSVSESAIRVIDAGLDRSNSKIWKSTPSGWQKRMSYVRQKQQHLETLSKQDETRMKLERKLVEMRKERNGLEKVISRLSVRERRFNERMRREEAFLERKYAKLYEEAQDLRQSRAELNRKQYELRNLFQLVHQDELTGLQNVRRFKQVAWDSYQKFCHNKGLLYTMIFIDIDFFKDYNDASETGHENGDLLLKLLGQALRECFSTSACFRRGGDEFVAILSDSSRDESIAKCVDTQQRLRDLCKEYEIDPATLSIGIGDLSTEDKFEDWFKKTEDAMYFIKLRTKNDVCHYTDLTSHDLCRLEHHRKNFSSSSVLGRVRVQIPEDEEMKEEESEEMCCDLNEQSFDTSMSSHELPRSSMSVATHYEEKENLVSPPTDYAEMMDLVEHWLEDYDKQNEGQIHIDWVSSSALDLHLSASLEQIGVIHIVDVIKVLFEMKDEENEQLEKELNRMKRKYQHKRKLLRDCSKQKSHADKFIDNLKSACAAFEEQIVGCGNEKLQLERDLENLRERYHQNHNELAIVRNEVLALRERLRKMSKKSQDQRKSRRRFPWGNAKETKTKHHEQIESLQRQIQQYEREIDGLRDRSRGLEEENSELNATCEDLKRSKLKCIVSLSEQIEHMREESEYFVRTFSPRNLWMAHQSHSSASLLSPRSPPLTPRFDAIRSPSAETSYRPLLRQRSKSLTSIPCGLPF